MHIFRMIGSGENSRKIANRGNLFKSNQLRRRVVIVLRYTDLKKKIYNLIKYL